MKRGGLGMVIGAFGGWLGLWCIAWGGPVDTIPPAIARVIPNASIYGAGQRMTLTVGFSEAVQVTGSPQLVMTLGSTTRTALYLTTLGSTLTFAYTPQSPEVDFDGVDFLQISLNGGTIKDLANNVATLLTISSAQVRPRPVVDTLARGLSASQMGESLPAVNLGTGKQALQIAAGANHTCALLIDGNVKCWGANNFGQLGQGTTTTIGPVVGQMGDTLQSIDLGPGRKALQLTAGREHTCALLDDGSLKCWGANTYGQIGPQNY